MGTNLVKGFQRRSRVSSRLRKRVSKKQTLKNFKATINLRQTLRISHYKTSTDLGEDKTNVITPRKCPPKINNSKYHKTKRIQTKHR